MNCAHVNALPYTSEYMHYCIDCGRSFYNQKGLHGFQREESVSRGSVGGQAEDQTDSGQVS